MESKGSFASSRATSVKTSVCSIFKYLCLFVVTATVLISPVTQAYSAQSTLAWDSVNDSKVAGYKLHYGSTPGSYTKSLDTGKTTSATVTDLSEGQTYYFASTAYDSAGNQSAYSNEVSKLVPSTTQYSLMVARNGSGTGTVTGSGIDCGSVCTNGYAPGTVVTLTATPASGSSFAGWSGGGCSGTGTCSVTMNASTSVTATFDSSALTYDITATAKGNGTITADNNPNVSQGTSGDTTISVVKVTKGANQVFTIAPKTGNYTASVSIDGAVVATNLGNYSYTFSGVAAAHTINATFATATYTIAATAGTGGTISPASVVVNHGASQTISITPNSGYKVADVKVNGTSVGAVASYTFSNVTSNQSISATFTTVTTGSYSVTASAGAGGSISPSGSVSVTSGSSKTFTVSPNAGYYTASVSVDGVVVATNQGFYSYTFSNVIANHTISATFAVATASSYTITASAALGGIISPTGSVSVTGGSSKTYTVAPKTRYRISDVKVNGVSKGAISLYTFSNVAANQTIQAYFSRK